MNVSELYEVTHSTGQKHIVNICHFVTLTSERFECQWISLGLRYRVSVGSCSAHAFM